MPCLQNMSNHSCHAPRCRNHLIYNVCTTLDIFLLNKDLCYNSNTIEHMIKCQPMLLWRDISVTILPLSWYFCFYFLLFCPISCFVWVFYCFLLISYSYFSFCCYLFWLLFLIFFKILFSKFIPIFRFLQTHITKVRKWKSK